MCRYWDHVCVHSANNTHEKLIEISILFSGFFFAFNFFLPLVLQWWNPITRKKQSWAIQKSSQEMFNMVKMLPHAQTVQQVYYEFIVCLWLHAKWIFVWVDVNQFEIPNCFTFLSMALSNILFVLYVDTISSPTHGEATTKSPYICWN